MKYLIFSIVSLLIVSSCKTKNQDQDSELETIQTTKKSTVVGLGIQNAHVVVSNSSRDVIFRSRAPSSDQDFKDISTIGITDVVIFKKETGKEVQTEIQKLQLAGLTANQIDHIPFLYKDFPDYETPCKQTLAALSIIAKVRSSSSRKVLFHCTVGEDRTGYLAGLIKLLEGGDTVSNVFQNEMCANGYSSGNPNKPKMVSHAIDRDLTPLFLKLSYYINSGDLNWKQIDANKICGQDPENLTTFKKNKVYSDASTYICK